uniref:Methyltransferase domain-containing protein n=2 Tax=Setaria TaxID=4554 RepID=K3Z9C5_SETIT
MWARHVRDRRPFQYVVGNEHWRDLVVAVRDGVLIPRPETEAVVDMVRNVEGFADGWWADLGTGSGAIAVAVARELGPEGKVFAVDVSEVAIEVARLNVQRYGMQDKVEIRHGSWFEPLEDVKGKLMGVISNPPYIPTDDLPRLQPEVGWHEPKLALDGGKDGLEHLLHLCEGLSSVLKPGGFFVFETNGNKQSEFLVDLISTKWSSSFHNVEAVLDFAEIKRFVTGYRR